MRVEYRDSSGRLRRVHDDTVPGGWVTELDEDGNVVDERAYTPEEQAEAAERANAEARDGRAAANAAIADLRAELNRLERVVADASPELAAGIASRLRHGHNMIRRARQ